MPMRTPVSTLNRVTMTAMYSEVRMPYSSIVNTSRPSFGSTPNQKSPLMPPLALTGKPNSLSSPGVLMPYVVYGFLPYSLAISGAPIDTTKKKRTT